MIELACVLGAGACIALVVRAYDDRPATVVPLVVPAIAPPVEVHPAPAQVVVEPPPPTPSPEPPAPRAVVPRVEAACVLQLDSDRVCGWDDGFPAISRDGTTIAMKYIPEDGGRGYQGLSIELVDVATSRSRFERVLSPDEYDPDAPAKLLPRIARRAAAIQKQLIAGGYRTIDPLGSASAGGDESKVHAEFEGDAIRIVDPRSNRVLWQDRLTAPNPRSAGRECSGWSLAEQSAWWDPRTGTVLVAQTYVTGGCMCDGENVRFVRHVNVAK